MNNQEITQHTYSENYVANGSRATVQAVSHQPLISDAWLNPRLLFDIGFVVNNVQLGQVFL